MKFIHIADIHIGARPDSDYPWGTHREQEIMESFRDMIDICNEKEIDLLLIAGDLFHKQPLLRELKEVNYCFLKLRKTKVVLIAGNHDYISLRSNYREFIWADHVTMLMDASLDSVYFDDLNTEVYGLSYHTRFITEPLYDTVKPQYKERINLLLAHGGNQKDIPMDKTALLNSGFDYIALGHIHKPHIISSSMAYAGSLEPLDKNEIGERGYILGEIVELMNQEADRSVTLEFIPHSVRRYHKIELTVHPKMTGEELLDLAKSKIEELGKEHIYQFKFTGIRDTDVIFKKEDFMRIGNVIEVVDETVPDYDFDALYQENQDNIIGQFIQKIKEKAGFDNQAKKALYYGMEALFRAKNYK